MKIEKFEKFFESNKRNLTIDELGDLLIDAEDLFGKGSVSISVLLYSDIYMGFEKIEYCEMDYQYKDFGFLIYIRSKLGTNSDILEKSEKMSELWSIINTFVKRINPIFLIKEVKEYRTSGSNSDISLIVITQITEYTILWTSNYFLEALLLNYNNKANILNKSEGSQFFLSIKKEDIHSDIIEDIPGIELLIDDYINDTWGKKNLEYELIETEDSYVFKNFKIKDLFK